MKAQRLICTDIRRIELAEFELPRVPDHGILVQNDYTAVSVGTEIYGYTHGGEPSSAITFPRSTGYCNTGVVLEVGKDVQGLQPGDRIAGQGNHASHAILTDNFRKAPAGVSPKSAAFMVMCAIALHGHRVGRPELGEVVAITGMGIVGQLALTFARLAGASQSLQSIWTISAWAKPKTAAWISASIPIPQAMSPKSCASIASAMASI